MYYIYVCIIYIGCAPLANSRWLRACAAGLAFRPKKKWRDYSRGGYIGEAGLLFQRLESSLRISLQQNKALNNDCDKLEQKILNWKTV